MHLQKCLFTSSQATTVGPSHWAKGKPFLLASSSSSCLRVGAEDTLYEHADLYIHHDKHTFPHSVTTTAS